jgi:hypothetical protein
MDILKNIYFLQRGVRVFTQGAMLLLSGLTFGSPDLDRKVGAPILPTRERRQCSKHEAFCTSIT